MDESIFVQNIKRFCALRGISVTAACRESGAGKDLVNQIERQRSMPSVEKVYMLAQYLEVTVSELLGENLPDTFDTELSPEEHRVIEAYRRADERARNIVQVALEPFAKKKTVSAG